ncbi:hypothetical protein FKV24_001975 [Lysobacter maris]|uniref:Uncharacterized protein n=1 Tax=Marilutibacter maris TaxID=1605891 RepID=A0A508B5I3_9GAMM|nr:hypothetical protein [Lysobacter maris]KAB8198461.1 hypothetical protein FKV24_001975 [Lysobacter maris]
MTRRSTLALCLMTSGVVIACGDTLPLPTPPTPVKVSWTDVGKAIQAGYKDNSLYAAAMTKLDALGAKAVGHSTWKANNYAGYFSYAGPLGGAAQVFVEKPCNQNAIDMAEKDEGDGSVDSGGGGEGAGGTQGGGGYTGPIGGGCYGNCGGSGSGTVVVGDPDKVVTNPE